MTKQTYNQNQYINQKKSEEIMKEKYLKQKEVDDQRRRFVNIY